MAMWGANSPVQLPCEGSLCSPMTTAWQHPSTIKTGAIRIDLIGMQGRERLMPKITKDAARYFWWLNDYPSCTSHMLLLLLTVDDPFQFQFASFPLPPFTFPPFKVFPDVTHYPTTLPYTSAEVRWDLQHWFLPWARANCGISYLMYSGPQR